MSDRFLDMQLHTSPHFRGPLTVDTIMRHVVWSLLPVTAMAFYSFGLSALALIATTIAVCNLTEWLVNRLRHLPNSLPDFSVTITGLLLGLTLPPGLPLWMAAVGAVVAVLLGKSLFGGLGCNLFNPALVGRAFLQAAFPVALTTWAPAFHIDRFTHFFASTLTTPFLQPATDALSGATPLAAFKFERQITATADLFLGRSAGSVGETSALLIVIGGLYLALRRMLDWRIPAAIFGSVALLTTVLHTFNANLPDTPFMLFSGGLMLGAVYMATDMVTSPVTPIGVWLYGALIGVLVVIIRIWGGLPEGVMYAILLGNALTPMLNRLTQPRVYGTGKAPANTKPGEA